MKIRNVVVLLVFGLVIQLSFAQQVDRIIRGQRGYVPPPKYNNNTFIELKDLQEELQLIVPKVEAAFNLDAFEKEIFKNLLTKKIETENAVLTDEKNTRDDRKKKIILCNNKFLADLSSIFSQEEIEDYQVMNFDDTPEEKKKKKKKKKKNKDKT